MNKKLIDYEGFEAYTKGVRDKYADKKDIITPNERQYIQLSNNGFELIRYWDAEALIAIFVTMICRQFTTTLIHNISPAYSSLVDLCLDNDCEASKIAKDKRYVDSGFLGVLQKGMMELPNVSVLLVKSYKGKDLTIEEISAMWQQKTKSPLIWVYKDMLKEFISKHTIQDTLDLCDPIYVKKEDRKRLSTNDYTDKDKQKVNTISKKANKSEIPKKLSQLENDKTFKTESEIQSMIEKASSLKKEVVTSLPTTGKDDVIYLVKDPKGKDNNNYLEYLWLNGKYELIGSTQVDLSGYVTNAELNNSVSIMNESLTSKIKIIEQSTHNILDKDKDKAIVGDNGTNILDDKTYTTPEYVNWLTSLLTTEQFKMFEEVLKTLSDEKLDKTDIQEFTQQELEEAFK